MSSRAILVLGMHRSGTSALTGTLARLGVYPGRTLIAADQVTNPRGFWEPVELVSIHEELLELLGSGWDDGRPLPPGWWEKPEVMLLGERLAVVMANESNGKPLLIIKDPRLCRLLPLWERVLQKVDCRPMYLLCLRHPAEVAASLGKRDGLTQMESYLLWASYTLDAERLTRGETRILVTYEQLLEDWRGVAGDIADSFEIEWPVSLDRAADSIESFLEPALRHHKHSSELPENQLCRMVTDAFEVLTVSPLDYLAVDEMRARIGEFISSNEAWLSILIHYRRKSQSELSLLRASNATMCSEIKRIKNTISWRLTKPLRLLANLPRLMRTWGAG